MSPPEATVVQPRALLVLLTMAAGGFAFMALPPAARPIPPGFGYTPPLDLDSLPGIPFACITPMPLGHKPPEEYHWFIDTRMDVSADLRYLEAESNWSRGGAGSRLTVRRWDLLTGRYAGERDSDRTVRSRFPSELLSADGRTRIERVWPSKATKHTARVVRTDGLAEPLSLAPDACDRDVVALDVRPDGRLVYLADGRELQVWTTNPVRHLRTLATLTVKDDHEPQGVEVISSPDGKYVATVLDEHVSPIHRGGWGCGSDLQRPPHTPAGSRKQVILWDTKTWDRIHEQTGSEMWRFVWTADGRFSASSVWPNGPESRYEVELTDPRRGLTSGYRVDFDPNSHSRKMTFNADGRYVVWWSGSRFDMAEFELSDVTARRSPRCMFIGRPLDNIQFTADSRFLVTLHRDQSVRLFDLCGATQPNTNRTADQLWGDLVSDDAGTVFRAARVLIERGNEVVPFLKAAGGQRAGVPAEQIREWIDQLGSRDYRTREAATRKLADHMHDADPHLRAARSNSLEATERLDRLLTRTPPPTAETRRTRWLVYVLEQIHSESSVAVLREWAARPMPFGLTAEADRAVRDITNGQRAINP